MIMKYTDGVHDLPLQTLGVHAIQGLQYFHLCLSLGHSIIHSLCLHPLVMPSYVHEQITLPIYVGILLLGHSLTDTDTLPLSHC